MNLSKMQNCKKCIKNIVINNWKLVFFDFSVMRKRKKRIVKNMKKLMVVGSCFL